MRRLPLLALLFAAAPFAGAQTIYRCGNSFSQQACPAGVEVAVAKDRPSREDAARAASAAKADAQRADAMERARLAQEASAPKAIVLGAPQAAASAPLAAKAKDKGKGKKDQARPGPFTAVAQGPAPAKKK